APGARLRRARPAGPERAASQDRLAPELVDPAVAGCEVELAGDVLPERGQRADAERLATNVDRAAVFDAETPDDPGAVVAVEVAAGSGRDRTASIDVAARDGTALVMSVDLDGPD